MNYQHAQVMIELGYPVIPLHRTKKSPLTGKGGVYNATTDLSVVAAWSQRFPYANTGIHPGGHPDNIVVFDFDTKYGGLQTYRRLIDKGLIREDTPTVETGSGGLHVYQSAPRGVTIKNKNGSTTDWNGFGTGMDVKGVGGLIVAANSIHANGNPYRWLTTPYDHAYDSVHEYFLERLLEKTTTTAPERRERHTIAEDYALLPGIPDDFTGSASGLVRYLHYDCTIPHICRLLKIPNVGLGVAFKCVLPGHEENHPSATLVKAQAGHVLYHEFHDKGQYADTMPLAAIYHAQQTGEVRRLNDCELARWTAKLLVDSGVVPPASVNLPPLPSKVRGRLGAVYEAYRDMMGYRMLIGDTHAPFSPGYIEEHYGIDSVTAWRGRNKLEELKILRKVDLVKGEGHDLWTYGVGSGL